jgi:hypothetical protein
MIPEADLDSQVLKHLSQKFFTKERIREIVVHVNRELTDRRNRNSPKLKTLHQELKGVRIRIRKHYDAIESGILELDLVSERLRELKEWESEIRRQLKRYQSPKQLPPYLFKDEILQKIQARLDEIFMSNERGMAKEYLKFFLDRIEVNGRDINLVANTVALCNFSLIKKTGETTDMLTAVPPFVLSWLGEGVLENRIDFGPGYRVYFGRDGDQIVILLGGGTKKRQQKDIEAAKILWKEYKRRKRQES